MIIYLLKMFVISLGLTLLIELAVAKLLRVEFSKKNIYLILLVNLLTNPPAVFLIWLGRQFIGMGWDFVVEIVVEIIVVIIEAVVYMKFVQEEGWRIKRPILLAVVANVVSWGTGVLLQL